MTCPCLQQAFLALPFLVLSAKEGILDHPCLGLRGQGLSLKEPGRQEEQLGLCSQLCQSDMKRGRGSVGQERNKDSKAEKILVLAFVSVLMHRV